MSVEVDSSTNLRILQTSIGLDFASPLGTYVVEATAVGDASGGVVGIDCDYPNNYLYSLEGVYFNASTASLMDVVTTWIPQIQQGGFGFTSFHDMDATVLRQVGEARDIAGRYPISTPHIGQGGAVRFSIEYEVNANTIVYRMAHWGYYWDKRALKTPTGPRRPL